MDQRDAFGEPGRCEPGGLPVRLDFRPLDSDQVMKEFGSVDEPVVPVGEAGPESCGDFLADVDEGRAMMPPEVPVLLSSSPGPSPANTPGHRSSPPRSTASTTTGTPRPCR